MHIFIMPTTGMQGLKKNPLKTVGGVDYTIYIKKGDECVMDRWTYMVTKQSYTRKLNVQFTPPLP